MAIMALSWPVTSSAVKFAVDSLLEGDGFELSVPLRKERRFRPLITRNSLTTTPSAFQIGGIPYAPKESREQQRQRFSPEPSP